VQGKRTKFKPDFKARVALDGLDPLRRKVVNVLVEANGPQSIGVVAARCALPETSVRRRLVGMRVHGVIDLIDDWPEKWGLSNWASNKLVVVR
jgi:hypothetical protein